MFNVILGSLFPDEGKVYLGDKDITKLKDYKRALNIGCLYQNPLRGTAPNLTIEENLALAYTRKASPSFFALNKRTVPTLEKSFPHLEWDSKTE